MSNPKETEQVTQLTKKEVQVGGVVESALTPEQQVKMDEGIAEAIRRSGEQEKVIAEALQQVFDTQIVHSPLLSKYSSVVEKKVTP